MKLWHDLWRDECGFILSTELLLIASIVVVGLVTGLVLLRDAALGGLGDIAGAIGGLDQSYSYSGVSNACGSAFTSGGSFRSRFAADNRQRGDQTPAPATTNPAVVPSPPAANMAIVDSQTQAHGVTWER